MDGCVEGEGVGDIDLGVFIGADDEAGTGYCPMRVMFRCPGEQEVFLREVEIFVGHAESGRVFCHGQRCGTEVDCVVLSTRLEEEAFGDDRGEGECREEV